MNSCLLGLVFQPSYLRGHHLVLDFEANYLKTWKMKNVRGSCWIYEKLNNTKASIVQFPVSFHGKPMGFGNYVADVVIDHWRSETTTSFRLLNHSTLLTDDRLKTPQNFSRHLQSESLMLFCFSPRDQLSIGKKLSI